MKAYPEAPLEARLTLVVEMLETAARELREAIDVQRETLPCPDTESEEEDETDV